MWSNTINKLYYTGFKQLFCIFDVMKSTVILVTDNGFKEVKPFRDLKSACDHYGLNHRYLLGKITDKPRYYKGYLIKKEIIG